MSENADLVEMEDPAAMNQARKKLAKLGVAKGPAARKKREKKIRAAVDGRSLTATGRVIQFNFKCTLEIKGMAVAAAEAEGISIAEWMERLIIDAVEKGA
jgi:hypothetical protein